MAQSYELAVVNDAIQERGESLDSSVIKPLLPTELVIYILRLALPELSEPDSSIRPPSKAEIMLPWRASAVCRRWRAIALSIPTLWTYIYFDFRQYLNEQDSYMADRVRIHCQGLELQLERTSGKPLDIFVEDISWPTDENSRLPIAPPCPLWLILIPHIHRSRTLHVDEGRLNCLLDSARSRLLPVPPIFPYLQRLTWEQDGYFPFDICQDAPCLRQVCLRNIEPIMDRLPFSQLTVVDLSHTRRSMLPLILDGLPRVESLKLRSRSFVIDTYGSSVRTPALPANRKLSKLTRLDIQYISDVWTQDASECLFSAPKLEVLQVGDVRTEHTSCLSEFLVKNGRSLTTLTIGSNDALGIGIGLLEDILKNVPTITDLNMDGMLDGIAVIDLLGNALPEDDDVLQPKLCPSLRRILIRQRSTLERGIDIKTDISTLLNMVRVRKRFGLERMELSPSQTMTSEVDSESEELEDQYIQMADEIKGEGFDCVFRVKSTIDMQRSLLCDLRRIAT